MSTGLIDAIAVTGPGSEHVENLWRHAFITNKILHYIYQNFLKKKIPEIASSAGLLHNIGKIFVLKSFLNSYPNMIKKSQDEGLDILTLEKTTYGITHQEAGGYLLKWWELPLPIVESALYHHQPLDKRIVFVELVNCVHIAQKYAWDIIGEEQQVEFFNEAFLYAPIDRDLFESSLNEIDWE